MNRFSLSLLVSAATICALPGISSAQWSAEGPASRHDSGYVNPYSGSSASGRAYAPSYAPSYYQPQVIVVVREPEVVRTASIQVQVPANAVIWFDEQKTSQTGPQRTFVSPPLDAGKKYTYVVHARWMDGDGKMIDQTKRIEVEAGQRSTADFATQLTQK
jgi:uncharacterized protein (TIGR03000 family)